MIKQHWAQIFLKQDFKAIVPLREGKQHQIDLVTLVDQSQWICKRLVNQNWLGTVDFNSVKLGEDLATKVAQTLGTTFSAAYVIEDLAIIVPYCQGEILEWVNENQAHRLGRILAQIHSLQSSTASGKPFPAISVVNSEKMPKWLNTRINYCNQKRLCLSNQWVLSHRDIHYGNVIWRDENSPHLIDWESTGLIHPTLELIGLAQNCAGIAAGRFGVDLFRATLQGYVVEAGKLPTIDGSVSNLSLHSWLLWYVHCLRQGWLKESKQVLQRIELISDLGAEIEKNYLDFKGRQ